MSAERTTCVACGGKATHTCRQCVAVCDTCVDHCDRFGHDWFITEYGKVAGR